MCDWLGHSFETVISCDYDSALSVCIYFFIWKSNIHICRPYMYLYSYILVLYYAHYAINFDENTFYFNFTTTFTSYIVITFSFSYHYTFTTSWLRQKTLFFLLIIKLILPICLLRQDLEKLHSFISSLLLLLRPLQCDSDKKNINLTFATFIFLLNPRLLLPSTCHDQDNSFFISLLRSYVMIKRKIINLVTTFTTPRP